MGLKESMPIRVPVKEKEIVRLMKEWAQYHPEVLLIRNHTSGILTESGALRPNENRGAADYIMQVSFAGIPVCVWLECKSTMGKLSNSQKAFQQRVLANKGFYFIIRDVQDAEDALSEVERQLKAIVPRSMRR